MSTEDNQIKMQQEGRSLAGSQQTEAKMLETVRVALDEWDLVYQVIPKMPERLGGVQIVEFGMSGKYTNYRVIISMDADGEIFGVYYVCPMKIVEERRTELAQYFAAVNYKVMIGHFDLDFRDGEVRFKISTILTGTELSREMVKQMIGVSMKTMDRYFPGIMAVEFGNVAPLIALENIEREHAETQTLPESQ